MDDDVGHLLLDPRQGRPRVLHHAHVPLVAQEELEHPTRAGVVPPHRRVGTSVRPLDAEKRSHVLEEGRQQNRSPGIEPHTEVKEYDVEISPGGIVRTVTGTSYVWTGLTNGAAYTFRVLARNSTLDSEWSKVAARPIPVRGE